MREKCDHWIVEAAFSITFNAMSVFCVELMIDYLYTADLFAGDPYPVRINRPGTVNKTNWSLTMPLPLEKLLEHKLCARIKVMAVSGGRE